jgi:uncharacterized protein YkwD
MSAASWRVEAQQQYYPAADGSTTVYTLPAYIYQAVQAAQPVQYVQQPAEVQYVQQPAAVQYVQQPAEVQYVQQPADAQYVYPSGYTGVEAAQAPPAQPVYAEAAPAQAPAAATGDPYGFTAWLNSIRASYGLGAVGYDPNLASWAAMNNDQQASRGLGHHVMGPARRQNSAMGGFPGVEAMWMASPAHRAALLDPTISWIGIASAGMWWTFNAN